jgi:UDP-N-acetyl-D-mannosaminuronate dehydrogenase
VREAYDCAVVATDHSVFDYAQISSMPLIVDTRNALKQFSRPSIFAI